jgi:hypothetical protein
MSKQESRSASDITKARVICAFTHDGTVKNIDEIVELRQNELYLYRKSIDASPDAVAYAERYQKWKNRPIIVNDIFE